MDQPPEYLRNQSRRLHDSYRRNRRFTNIFFLVWTIFWGLLLTASILDRAAGMGWDYSSRDSWAFLGFIAAGAGLWLFATLIRKVLLAYVRHTYGPEPIGREGSEGRSSS